MITPEKPKDIDVLIDNKEKILATKKLFEIYKINRQSKATGISSLEATVINNFNYLTENGKFSRAEYYALFEKCSTNNDFRELAILTLDFFIEMDTKQLNDDNDLSGEQKGKLRTSIMWYNSMKKVISEKQGKISINKISEPALRDTPDWVLVLEEIVMSLSEVYALLEKNDDGNNEALPGAEDEVKEVRGKIDGL